MHVLVTVASKHGATLEIGQHIADRLREEGLEVDFRGPEARPDLDDYDAFVVGSGVYLGRWMGQARRFVEHNAEDLIGRPVWLFSSGPIGDSDEPADRSEGDRLLAEVHGREHRVFAGSIVKEQLGYTERLAVRMVKAPYGDYRPWAEIDEFATQIARELAAVAA